MRNLNDSGSTVTLALEQEQERWCVLHLCAERGQCLANCPVQAELIRSRRAVRTSAIAVTGHSTIALRCDCLAPRTASLALLGSAPMVKDRCRKGGTENCDQSANFRKSGSQKHPLLRPNPHDSPLVNLDLRTFGSNSITDIHGMWQCIFVQPILEANGIRKQAQIFHSVVAIRQLC